MDLKDQGRREPTMADLEAFERLLRDSLQQSGPSRSAPAAHSAQPEAMPRALDAGAMAELTRLIEAPLPFSDPPPPASTATTGAEPMAPQPAVSWQQLEAIPPIGSSEPTVFAPQLSTLPPAPPASPNDPLLAFEEELRRFDQRATEAPAPVDPYGAPHGDYPASAESSVMPHWQGEAGAAPVEAPRSALDEAEQRLAAQAALAAAAAGSTVATAKRSRKIFYGLGGVAVAGLAAIGVTFALNGRSPTQNAGVPVIAAKQEPTKERPSNPGGAEIPDQNRQVLAPKAAAEPPKPAQAVNTTEQPVDLTQQVVRRESVRVVAPSPFQNNQGQAPASGETAPTATAPQPAAPAAAPPAVEPTGEPRRVQSVRLGDPAPPPPVPQAQTPGMATGVAIAAGAAAIPAIATGSARSPGVTPTPPTPAAPALVAPPRAAVPTPPAPAAATPPAPAVATPPAPPKVETRPQSAVATAPTPRPTPPAATPPRPQGPAQPAAPRGENAPLSLNPPRPQQQAATTSAPAGGAGGWSVQLASRPTQDDARAAATQLGSRFSAQLGRSTTVVSGEANGRTVFRVRAQGYSQADANAACDRVKAAGGQCFVTR